jgi:5-methylcytosine-specific restriction endonuclease McrA
MKNQKLLEMSDLAIHEALKNKSIYERELLSEIVEHIAEVDRRKLFYQFNCRNLFEYLTRELKYSAGSAQRRIDAARLLVDVPELKSNLQSGLLNLTQVSVVAQSFKSVRNKTIQTKESLIEQKRLVLNTVKGKTIAETQELAAKELNIQPLAFEKKKTQADKTVRIEMTLTEQQIGLFDKVKELISHTKPGATVAEVFELTLREFIKRNDPAAPRRTISKKIVKCTSTSTVEPKVLASAVSRENIHSTPQSGRRPIPTLIKRQIFQKDWCCQWRDKGSNSICGSKFQLQIDHIKSVWKGGTNEPENLRLLCSQHNQIKYLLEVGRIS